VKPVLRLDLHSIARHKEEQKGKPDADAKGKQLEVG